MRANIFLISVVAFSMTIATHGDRPSIQPPKSWKNKNIMDMTDADMERLLDQWEEGDDPLEPDELPEHLRPAPQIDMSQIDPFDPDSVIKMTKQGKGVMMFVDAKPELSEEEADTIMKIWQTSLQNNHIIAERYPIEPKRSVFMFREGSQAVDAKNYLLTQPEIGHVTLEGQTYRPNEQSQTLKRPQPSKNLRDIEF